MTRKSLMLFFLLPAVALAAGPDTALKLVPQDAMGFVMVPSIKKLDANLRQAITTLGLENVLPVEQISLENTLRQKLSISEGLDPEGALLVVLATQKPPAGEKDPATSMPPMVQPVLLIPATSPKGVLQAMNATAGEEDLWSVPMGGSPAYACTTQNHVAFSPMPEMARAVARSTTSIAEKLKPEELKSLSGLDISIWLDGSGLVKTFRPQIDMFMAMFMMQAAADPAAGKMMENSKKQMDMLFNGVNHLVIGLGLGEAGMNLRYFIDANAGSELATMMKTNKLTDSSMLEGLPGGNFVIAGGQSFTGEATKTISDQIKMVFDMALMEASEANKQQLGKLQSQLSDSMQLVRGFRMALAPLESTTDGLFNVAIVLQTTDSGQFLSKIQEAVDAVKKLDPGEDQEAKQLQASFSFNKDAEKIGDLAVHHLSVDLSKLDTLEDDEVEEIAAILGSDKIAVRLAGVDARTVVMSWGGGNDRMKMLVDNARSGEAPLAKNSGIRNVAKFVPKDKYTVYYVSPDQGVELVKKIQRALDEEPLPVDFGQVNAPMVLTSTGKDEWAQADLFLPTDLMKATKRVITALLERPQEQTPTGSVEDDDNGDDDEDDED